MLAGCLPYDLVQPKATPIAVHVSVFAEHDTASVTWTSIAIHAGIDETGDFRHVALEPSFVDGRRLEPQPPSGSRLVSYGLVDTTTILAVPRMMAVEIPALASAEFSGAFGVPVVASPDSGRATLRGTEDLRLRIAYPDAMGEPDYEFASWNLSIRSLTCDAGASMLSLNGSGIAPAELRVPRSLIAGGGAPAMVACLRVSFARIERTETVSLVLSSRASMTWVVTVEP